MARIRTIKPEFFTSEDIVSLTPLARLFYVGLWCEADREGRMAWKPRTLKMRYLPGDDCDIDALAQELVASGLIDLYEVEGKAYAQIPSFTNHQVINNREVDSILPQKPARRVTRESGVKAEGRKEGREGKGKEGKEGKEHNAGADAGEAELAEGQQAELPGLPKPEPEPAPEPDLEAGFEEFWAAWPSHHRKGQRAKCLERWKAECLHASAGAVVANVEAWKRSAQWTKDGGQFIPAPLVYLNQSTYANPAPPPARQGAAAAAHAGFDKVDYREGIDDDGSFA